MGRFLLVISFSAVLIPLRKEHNHKPHTALHSWRRLDYYFFHDKLVMRRVSFVGEWKYPLVQEIRCATKNASSINNINKQRIQIKNFGCRCYKIPTYIFYDLLGNRNAFWDCIFCKGCMKALESMWCLQQSLSSMFSPGLFMNCNQNQKLIFVESITYMK